MPWRRGWQPTPVFLPRASPWTEKPGGLRSMELQRVRHDWASKHSTARKDSVTSSSWLYFSIFCKFTEIQKTDPFFTPRDSMFLKATLQIVPSESNKHLHIDEMVRRTWIWLTTNKYSILVPNGFRYNKYVPNWNDNNYLSITGLLTIYIVKNHSRWAGICISK